MKNSNSANDIPRVNYKCKVQTDINLLHSLTKHLCHAQGSIPKSQRLVNDWKSTT